MGLLMLFLVFAMFLPVLLLFLPLILGIFAMLDKSEATAAVALPPALAKVVEVPASAPRIAQNRRQPVKTTQWVLSPLERL